VFRRRREIRVDHSIGEALFNHACRSQALGLLEQGGAMVQEESSGVDREHRTLGVASLGGLQRRSAVFETIIV
jgi:hypothetical protein